MAVAQEQREQGIGLAHPTAAAKLHRVFLMLTALKLVVVNTKFVPSQIS